MICLTLLDICRSILTIYLNSLKRVLELQQLIDKLILLFIFKCMIVCHIVRHI